MGVFTFLACLTACAPKTDATTATVPATTGPTEILATDLPVLPTEELAEAPVPTGPVIEHLAAGSALNITFIRMITVTDGWATGGASQTGDHVLRTDDGGLTWHDVTPPQPIPPEEVTFEALAFFKNASTAWVVYGPPYVGEYPAVIFVWSTHDGGETWEYGSVSTSIGTEGFAPMFLTFADDTHGWLMVALGAGMSHVYVAIFSTTDGW